MKLSVKSQYALAALTEMALKRSSGELFTVVRLSEKLGLSKIYLEQVFSPLRRAGIVNSAKGASGGYQLARDPAAVTAGEIVQAVQATLFDSTPQVPASSPIESALREKVYAPLDDAVEKALASVSLEDLANAASRFDDGYMYYL